MTIPGHGTYRVVRIVKQFFEVEAPSREAVAGLIEDPYDTRIVQETVEDIEDEVQEAEK